MPNYHIQSPDRIRPLSVTLTMSEGMFAESSYPASDLRCLRSVLPRKVPIANSCFSGCGQEEIPFLEAVSGLPIC